MATLPQASLSVLFFATAFAYFMSRGHILLILKIFQTFRYYYICHGDLSSVVFSVTIARRSQVTEQ